VSDEKTVEGEPDAPAGLVPALPDRAEAEQDALVRKVTDVNPRGGAPAAPSPFPPGAVIVATYAGPLPPPQILAGYKEVIPDLPERLVRAWEDEAKHRRDLERKQHEADVRTQDARRIDDTRRVVFGFVLGLVGLAAAAAIGIAGHATAAAVVGGGSLAVMVAGFLRRARERGSGDGAK
jgi:uncharacterized membrane protein